MAKRCIDRTIDIGEYLLLDKAMAASQAVFLNSCVTKRLQICEEFQWCVYVRVCLRACARVRPVLKNRAISDDDII